MLDHEISPYAPDYIDEILHTMHPANSKSYIVPAIFLNAVLFLISLNNILSCVLPPVIVDAAKQSPLFSTFGPSAQHPHLNIHASVKLCWSYTFLIVCAQLAVFGMVIECREAGKLKARIKGERAQAKASTRRANGKAVYTNGNGHAKGAVELDSKTLKYEDQWHVSKRLWHLEASDEDSTRTSELVTIL